MIFDELRELTAIDSESFAEREMADCLSGKLRALGFEVYEDDAGARIGGNAGNIYGFLKGSLPGDPVLLSAHMDTVKPGIGKKAVLDADGWIFSEGDTVLGADDAAGIAEILEGIRMVRRLGLAHRDIEVLFFAAEEVYGAGSAAFDFSRVRAHEAYVFDLSGPVGTAAFQAPSLISFTASILGRAAHAGFEPEKGIHAIAWMAQALTRIRQGHLDEETTLNVGMISGGEGINIVPEKCTVRGEIRSFRHARALQCLEEVRQIFGQTAAEGNASFEFAREIHLEAYETGQDEPCVRHFRNACGALGLPGELIRTFGGSDNNNLWKHQIAGLVLSCGMEQVHSVRERIRLADLEMGARLAAELVTQS